MSDPRRKLPSVDSLLADPAFVTLCERHARGRVVDAIRLALEEVRAEVRAGAPPEDLGSAARYAQRVEVILERQDAPSLCPVVNATGVVLHTNLGRAPLADAAIDAMARTARGYSNLEYDLETGVRGSRYDHCRALLTELTGAGDALVVNNNAAALVLALNTVAQGEGVVVSRGELVEIGGGFRIPEILAHSGARLVEVGSTNRTRASDYSEAVMGGGVAVILKVHRSNFRMTGFTESVSLEGLAVVARASGLPLVYDLGSGLLARPDDLRLPDEPRAPDALRRGADLVVISGDKLLGGPQAGIALGRRELVGAMRRNPLCRALRVDKVTLAGLEATLRLYRDPAEAIRQIPVLRMLAAAPEALEGRARALAERLRGAGVDAEAAPGEGAVGGGTYPEVALPSWTVRLLSEEPERAAAALRAGDPAVVARIQDGRVVLDVRTVSPDEDEAVFRVVSEAMPSQRPPA